MNKFLCPECGWEGDEPICPHCNIAAESLLMPDDPLLGSTASYPSKLVEKYDEEEDKPVSLDTLKEEELPVEEEEI